MGYTSLSNVIVPEIFVPYVIERTAAKSKILQSGIAVANPALNELVTKGGTTMKMPFWQDLQGRSQLWTEGSDISVSNITAAADIAALLLRAQAWGATDMSGALAGDDPMKAIGELVSDYWARDEQTTLLYILKGVFASSSMADHILDKTSASGTGANIDGNMVLDAKQLLGDAADKLQAIAMHSATFTSLQKQNLITTVMETGPSNSQVAVPTYLGYRVVVDDAMPVDQVYKASTDTTVVAGKNYYTYNSTTGVYTKVASPTGNPSTSSYYEEDYKAYTTYLFARGVIGRGEGTPVSFVPVETDRNSLGSKDVLIHRRAFVMHPYGIKWAGSPTAETPSDAELQVGTNWVRVYESKNIGIVAIKHKIA